MSMMSGSWPFGTIIWNQKGILSHWATVHLQRWDSVATSLTIHEAHHYKTVHDTPVPATSKNQSINTCEILTGNCLHWRLMVNIVRKCQAGQEWGDVEMGIGKWLSFGWVSILFWCHFQSVDKLVFICLFDICRVVPLLFAYASFAFDFLPDRVAFQATTYVAGHRSKRLDRFPRFRGFGRDWKWILNLVSKLHGMLHKTPFLLKRSFLWFEHHRSGFDHKERWYIELHWHVSDTQHPEHGYPGVVRSITTVPAFIWNCLNQDLRVEILTTHLGDDTTHLGDDCPRPLNLLASWLTGGKESWRILMGGVAGYVLW